MAVAYDTVGPSSAGASATATNTVSWSHTCSGSSRLLIAAVAVGQNPDTGITTSATYNSVAMTSVGVVHANNSGSGYVQMFRLVNPASGANTVAVTASTTVNALSAGSVSFTGVDQTTPIGTPATAFGFSTTPSVAVTGTTAGNMVIDAMVTGTGVTSSTQTLRWSRITNTDTAGGIGASATADAGGSVTMSYSITSDWWGIVAVEVLAEASGITERFAPDAILAQTGLTGAVAAIQDDPDSPDGSWLTA